MCTLSTRLTLKIGKAFSTSLHLWFCIDFHHNEVGYRHYLCKTSYVTKFPKITFFQKSMEDMITHILTKREFFVPSGSCIFSAVLKPGMSRLLKPVRAKPRNYLMCVLLHCCTAQLSLQNLVQCTTFVITVSVLFLFVYTDYHRIIISESILLLKRGLMSRATLAIGRGFLSASRLMDGRAFPKERRASSMTPPSDMWYTLR